MSVAAWPSERDALASAALNSIRATGGVSVAFHADGGVTRVSDLEERGGYRAKFPKGDIGAEAVFINTGGGMLGGDRYRFDVEVGTGAAATVASQSAERIYRALGPATETRVALNVHAGASLAWLPQETILFNGARLARKIDADIAADGTLILCEAVLFGRDAMGETVSAGALTDQWRIRRDGHLIFAEAASFNGNLHQSLQAKAVADGARAMATLVYVAPDAEDRRDAAREALGVPQGRAAISAWNGLLTARFLAVNASTLRHDLIRVVSFLTKRAMPRVWNC